jgi:ABC-type glycerol-3-phosphate transport system substrate-binding protein
MKKIFTSLLMALALCTAIIAAVRTEMRMHVFSNGDNGMNMVKALAEVTV